MATVSFIYNRKNKVDKNGLAAIFLRITINRTPYYLSTGIKIIPGHWDNKRQEVKKNNKYWHEYNTAIYDKKNIIEDYFARCISENKEPKYIEVKELFNKTPSVGLVSFIENEMKLRKDISLSTYNSHKAQLNKLKQFKSEIDFKDVDYNLLQNIDNFLISLGNSKNTIWKFHKCIKTYINIAIKKGVIEKNPYDNYQVKYVQTKRTMLTFAELKRFEEIEIKKDVKGEFELVKDKFLFGCYTGLRISDIHNLKINDISFEGNNCYLSIRMVKTMKYINLPLHELFNGKAIDIINKYYQKRNTFLFPKQSEQHINRYLKTLASNANINKNITFHVSRHTFGSCLAEITGDPFIIMELMGHSKIETSMGYIHLNHKRIENKLNRFDFDY